MHAFFRLFVLSACLISVMAGTANLIFPLTLGKSPWFSQWETLITLTAFGSYLLLLALDWPMIRQRHARIRRRFS